MATAEEASGYREDLLKAGVGIEFDKTIPKLLRTIATRRGDVLTADNRASAVHGVRVEDVLLCGLFLAEGRHDGGHVLVLPPSKEVFEAAVDFLRFEAMRGKHEHQAAPLHLLADAVEEQGIKSKILDKLGFRNGTTAISKAERDRDNKEIEKITGGHKARVIGCWAVHKAITGDEKGFRVTHRTTGRAAGGVIRNKKAAMALAKTLAESHYPWCLLNMQNIGTPEWKSAGEFAGQAIKTAGDAKTKNPRRGRQLTLFS